MLRRPPAAWRSAHNQAHLDARAHRRASPQAYRRSARVKTHLQGIRHGLPATSGTAAAAKTQAPTCTTIHDLGGDLILEILLRLPSLSSLIRAAVSCRAFLAAVRSSPAFRRRFRALHPPPLLSFFFESIGKDIPSFSPIRRRSDPDLAAAVRGADVFLTRLPYHDEASTGWKIAECSGGYLLLLNGDTEQIAVYNPLTRALDLFSVPPDEIADGHRGNFSVQNCFVLSSGEAPGSFRVVCCCLDNSRVRAAVFSSGTREWQILPWSPPAPGQPSDKGHWLLAGKQANGNLHLAHVERAYKVVLDTLTLQFSFIDLPEHLKGKGSLYMTGETKNGKLCIVSVVGFTLHIWFRVADTDGVEKWVVDKVIPLKHEVLQATETAPDDPGQLKVWAVLDGVVYFSALIRGQPSSPRWFLSFCLETRKLEKLFYRTFDNGVYPYIMAWPSSLWEVENVIPLEHEVFQATETSPDDDDYLKMWAVLDGVVFCSPVRFGDPSSPTWFLSFCLETRNLEKLFYRTFDNCVYPYIMAWPPSLVCNCVSS
ncbi:hypothetical protein EJB05_01889, partial [Eragrostis curvula]